MLFQSTTNLQGDDGVSSIKFSSSGKFLAVGYGDGSIVIWDTVYYKTLRMLNSKHLYPPQKLLFSKDEKSLISSDGIDLKIWDLRYGSISHELKYRSYKSDLDQQRRPPGFQQKKQAARHSRGSRPPAAHI